MDVTNKYVLPFDISLSFESLIRQYQDRLLVEENKLVKQHLQALLDELDNYPELISGIKTSEQLERLKEPIDLLMGDLFPEALSLNEIKAANVPFQQQFIYQSTRLKNIFDAAGGDYQLKLLDFSDDEMYIMACNNILAQHYKIQTNLQKPFYYSIPDKTGKIRTYRLAVNADYVSVKPTDRSVEITSEDVDQLLMNYSNIELWKEKFPPKSWELSGFILINFIDVTVDTVISDIKSAMLNHSITNDNFDEFQGNFRRYFNSEDIKIGFTKYDSDLDSFINPPGKVITSFILGDASALNCKTGFCHFSYEKVIKENVYITVSDIDWGLSIKKNEIFKRLQDQGFKSCIIAPIVVNNKLIGALEIVSPNKNELNSVNATRLDAIMPYLIATAERSNQETENYIKAIIQNECTAIHPAVLWKFEEEAQRFMQATLEDSETKPNFKDITFDYVHPLFGQIDIIGSSTVRNEAIKADFIKQLQLVKAVFLSAIKEEKLDFYEHVIQRIEMFINDFESDFNTASEEQLLHFLKNEINPIMPHIKQLSTALKTKVLDYEISINPDTGVIYEKRKDYENTVQYLNTKMASLIDKKQKEAQNIYPHLFERYKTDGVEHNMYIGQSLVKNKPYSRVYLSNLKLWQLTTMCEMERSFYEVQKDQPVQLDCASLLLVFGNNLSVRYRIDEKKFDVDGAYNARYEIIKKRIDKAHIKGTNERITQKGKLVIVYSQKKDELEYKRYLNYLQSKGYIKDDIEIVELEDLQGVVGLKAIRATVNYSVSEQKITYDDLVKELEG